MYPITMTSDNAAQIFDALCLGLNSISHDETAMELGWLAEVRRATDLLQSIRSARPSTDWRTPVDVLALSAPPISGGSPDAFQPTVDDWNDYAAWSHAQDATHRDLYGY